MFICKKLLSTAQDASYALCTHIRSSGGWANLRKLDINILIDELGKSTPNIAQTSDWRSEKLCEQTVSSKTDGGWLLNREVGASASGWTSPISFPFPLLEVLFRSSQAKRKSCFSPEWSLFLPGLGCWLWSLGGCWAGYREWRNSLLEEGTMGLVSPLPHHVWHKQPLGTLFTRTRGAP